MALAAAVLSPAAGASASSLHPKGLSTSLADGTVTLSWNAPIDDAEGVTGYQILRRRPGVDAVGTFHVVADDTATGDVSFTDRCADQPGTAYTYRVKARRGDQLSRWGNYSRIDLPASYVAADPQTGCHPDTGTPPTTTDGDSGNDDGGDGDGDNDDGGDPDNGDGDNDDGGDPNNGDGDGDNDDGGDPDDGDGDGDDGGDPDNGEGGVAGSAVSVKSDANYQQNNQDNKQFVPPPDDNDGEGVVPRSSLQNTGSAQFQDRSTLSGLPASYPNALGFDPGPPPAFARAEHVAPYDASERTGVDPSRFVPRDVVAVLIDDGITVSWQLPADFSACAEYDIERVPGTRAVTSYIRPDGLKAWKITETGAYYKYTCIDRRENQGFEIYRTSFGHVYRNGTVELLSDSQPYLIGTVFAHVTRFTDRSRDALVGPRRHIYQIRALYATHGTAVGGDVVIDRDFGSRLSPDAFIEREHDAAQPNAQSPRSLTVSIPTKEDVAANGATLGIHLDWDPPTADTSSVTEYVIQRRIVSARDRMLPYEDVRTITDTGTTSWVDTTTPDVVDTANQRLLRWRQFLYRIVAVRGTDHSNPSAAASTDSDRQLAADGLVTTIGVSRTGAGFRINMSGNDVDGNQLSDPARNWVRYAGYAKLLSVSIGTKSWGHYPPADHSVSPPRQQATPAVVDMWVQDLNPNTTYTAEVAFYIPAEETKAQGYVPTHTGGFNSGGIYGPRHLVGIVTFTTLS
ncbi:fibronectin type III domain-containing protein [Candidatus Poriferisodalis sp.]|uniref:fibronectin type III domain-containing protein n=1 Tax=Candidatus Poriferisodalis sp. TaxID=3101277 RepID=UPI003AF5F29C